MSRIQGASRVAVTGLRAIRARFPFDATLGAFNVGQIPVSQEVIREATDLYARVAPHLGSKQASVSDGECRFYALHPAGWPSDIRWWSADDEATFSRFQRLFDQVQPALAARGLLPAGGRLYCGFFVTRSRCSQAALHVDYVEECGANAYTLMTPLDDWQGTVGQLIYRDAFGRLRHYRYRKGSAIVLGAGFQHGTEPCTDVPRAFLCFTFGTSDPRVWRHIRKTVQEQGRLLRQHDGTFVGQTHRSDFAY